MCLLYGKGATAIFCDTGDEHREMYERLDLLESVFTEIHKGDFRLIRLKPQVVQKGQLTTTVSEGMKALAFMPSPNARWCTSDYKIEPIEQYLKEQGECELLIGLNADEEPGSVRTGNWARLKNVNYRYPLHEDGLDRKDCELLLNEYGLHPKFPIYMSRGGCKFCFYKSKAEYKSMYVLDRATFDEIWELERSLQDRRSKYYSILPNTTFQAIQDEVEREIAHWGGIENVLAFYRPQAQTKVCGVFCHR